MVVPRGMRRVSRPLHHGIEPVVVVGRVVHSPGGTVRFHQRVSTLDDVSVADLVLGLVVAGVRVLHPVRELVPGMSLENSCYQEDKRCKNLRNGRVQWRRWR